MMRVALAAWLAGLTWIALPTIPAAQETPAREAPVTAPAAPPQDASPAQSQDAPPPGPNSNRYTFHRIRDGFVRLDSQTGQMAQCGWNAAGWSCKAVPDERTALESEIARLQTANAALKKSLLSRGIDLPDGVRAESPAAKAPDPNSGSKGSAEGQLDRVMSYMEKVWRLLVEMMTDLKRDIQRKS
jgi:hypothetical protein